MLKSILSWSRELSYWVQFFSRCSIILSFFGFFCAWRRGHCLVGRHCLVVFFWGCWGGGVGEYGGIAPFLVRRAGHALFAQSSRVTFYWFPLEVCSPARPCPHGRCGVREDPTFSLDPPPPQVKSARAGLGWGGGVGQVRSAPGPILSITGSLDPQKVIQRVWGGGLGTIGSRPHPPPSDPPLPPSAGDASGGGFCFLDQSRERSERLPPPPGLLPILRLPTPPLRRWYRRCWTSARGRAGSWCAPSPSDSAPGSSPGVRRGGYRGRRHCVFFPS